MKKIYIDLSRLNPEYAGGVSRFALGLASALVATAKPCEIKVIASNYNHQFIQNSLPNADIIIHKYNYFYRHILAILSLLAYITKNQNFLFLINYYSPAPAELKSSDAVVLCSTSTLNFYNQNITSILCIHDIQHEIHPENFSFLVRAVRWAQYRLSTTRSKWIQVSSEAIRGDLINKFGSEMNDKIFIAPEGFDENLFASNLPTEKPLALKTANFIYYPAQLWKHKNHKTIIEGLSIFNQTAEQPISLILTGKDYGELANILAFAREKNVEVIHLGIVPETQMRWLYKNSVCAVAAGYHESSSLPIREAIASGGFALAADIPPNMEIKNLQGLYLFETFSPIDFAKQLAFILRKKDQPATENNLRIEDFSWTKISEIYRGYF